MRRPSAGQVRARSKLTPFWLAICGPSNVVLRRTDFPGCRFFSGNLDNEKRHLQSIETVQKTNFHREKMAGTAFPRTAWGSKGRKFESCRPDFLQRQALRRERRRTNLFQRKELRRSAGKASDALTAFQRALESARLEPGKRFFGDTNREIDSLAIFLRNAVPGVDFVLTRSIIV